jgi:tetratricopeptide (TPR) repeat protein
MKDPIQIKALWDRAIAFFEQSQYRESLDCLRTLEASRPDNPQLLSNLGVVYRDSGDLGRAEQYFRRICAQRPDDSAAHFNLAVTLLRAGRLREGFHEYEWRWQVAQFAPQRRQFSQPLWRTDPISAGSSISARKSTGRRILIYGEQGAGDAIQFVRYAPLVRSTGGDVILEVLPHLERLMSWMDGGYPVVNALSAGVEFDVQCPLMSLPLQFGTELDSIPPPARFSIPAALKAKWAARLQTERTGRLGVGVVWAANPNSHNSASRSIPARYLAPLTRRSGVQCNSLQVGPAAADIPEGMVDLSQELIDFGETAAAISALDLVITIDTAVAHLAGSLDKPVWLLLPYTPDWRWMLGREDTPWYPTMRLFRQKRPGEWADVVERVTSELFGGDRAK